MAHYAKLSDQNKVLQVLSVDNSVLGNPENEALGRTHLENIHGWPADMWKQCSYNTMGGIYYEQNENNEDIQQDSSVDSLNNMLLKSSVLSLKELVNG